MDVLNLRIKNFHISYKRLTADLVHPNDNSGPGPNQRSSGAPELQEKR